MMVYDRRLRGPLEVVQWRLAVHAAIVFRRVILTMCYLHRQVKMASLQRFDTVG